MSLFTEGWDTAHMAARSRPTIRDIARATGVSTTAVSFALNNRPGISHDTRERILQLAKDLGWTPSITARALSTQEANTVGLIIGRPSGSFASERFFFHFMTGVERKLSAHRYSFVFHAAAHMSDELATYERWWAERRVSAVIVVDLLHDDPRPDYLKNAGIPAVFAGELPGYGVGVTSDEESLMRRVISYAHSLGVATMGYVAGPETILHSERRLRAFTQLCADTGIDGQCIGAQDYTIEAGHAAIARLDETARIAGRTLPRLIAFDNEILCLGGTRELHNRGILVPEHVGVMSLEDSPLCEVMVPAVTAMRRDPAQFGERCARLAIDLLAGTTPEGTSIIFDAEPDVVERASTVLA